MKGQVQFHQKQTRYFQKEKIPQIVFFVESHFLSNKYLKLIRRHLILIFLAF